jgi:DNA-binding NarL/FixJ family response regulator
MLRGPQFPKGVLSLTPYQLQVAQLAVAGKTNPEIAQQLGREVHAIKRAFSRIFDKLGCTSRTQIGRKLRLLQEAPHGS